MKKDKTDNLRPIKPGEVRNPTGRNQYTGAYDLKEALKQLDPEGTWLMDILMDLKKQSAKGNTVASKELADRLVGKVKDIVQHEGSEENPVRSTLVIEIPKQTDEDQAE